jgi:hypothetical protein
LVRQELDSIDRMETFYAFVCDGIDYILSSRSSKREGAASSPQTSAALDLERFKDIQSLVGRLIGALRTGLSDGSDIFSTNADDYIRK